LWGKNLSTITGTYRYSTLSKIESVDSYFVKKRPNALDNYSNVATCSHMLIKKNFLYVGAIFAKRSDKTQLTYIKLKLQQLPCEKLHVKRS
jgi:hypothetical protein